MFMADCRFLGQGSVRNCYQDVTFAEAAGIISAEAHEMPTKDRYFARAGIAAPQGRKFFQSEVVE
jgi:hypothetical protein